MHIEIDTLRERKTHDYKKRPKLRLQVENFNYADRAISVFTPISVQNKQKTVCEHWLSWLWKLPAFHCTIITKIFKK